MSEMDYVDFIICAGIMSFLFCLMALIAKAKVRHDERKQDPPTRFLD